MAVHLHITAIISTCRWFVVVDKRCGGKLVVDTDWAPAKWRGLQFRSRLSVCLSVCLHVCMCMYSVSQKSSPPPLKVFAVFFFSWWTCITKNYLGYCPNIFQCLHHFWSIYLNICVKCIIFISVSVCVTPQILRIQFSMLRNL